MVTQVYKNNLHQKMAHLDTKGIEEEIISFLENGDLQVRSSEIFTKKLVDAMKNTSSDANIYVQHGGKVHDSALLVEVTPQSGKLLLSVSKDICCEGLEEKVIDGKRVVACLVPVIFTWKS
jgi:hypothetical protein